MTLRLRGCHATVILTAAGEGNASSLGCRLCSHVPVGMSLSLYIILPTDLSSSLGCLHKCLRKLLCSEQSCKGGLSNTCVAVITDSDVHQCINHKLVSQPASSADIQGLLSLKKGLSIFQSLDPLHLHPIVYALCFSIQLHM